MDIQVSGYTGFVGSNLKSYLANSPDINFVPLDCRSPGMGEPDIFGECIVHLAGKAHDLKRVTRAEEYYEVNLELTKKLYGAFLNSGARKFIFISSVKAVADTVSGTLTEEVSPNPLTHYGKSKLMAEEFILGQPLPPGKSFYILRPCMIHGPGNKGNLNLLYQLVAKGIPYPLAAFENKRSFHSVENLCFVIKEIVERDDIPTGIYHLADDVPLSTNELITLISQALGRIPRLLKFPIPVIKVLASIGDKLRLPLTKEKLNKLTENYVVSNKKIKSALGKELPLSSSDGILRTIRSFKNI